MMKKKYGIYELFQTGNIGPHNIEQVSGTGLYESVELAEGILKNLLFDKEVKQVRDWHRYTIIPIYTLL